MKEIFDFVGSLIIALIAMRLVLNHGLGEKGNNDAMKKLIKNLIEALKKTYKML